MRTLSEIIELVKSGETPTSEELYYTVAALDALTTFTTLDLRHLGLDPKYRNMGEHIAENDHERWRRALAVDPKTWLGESNDPKTPEYQHRREGSKRLAARVLGVKS